MKFCFCRLCYEFLQFTLSVCHKFQSGNQLSRELSFKSVFKCSISVFCTNDLEFKHHELHWGNEKSFKVFIEALLEIIKLCFGIKKPTKAVLEIIKHCLEIRKLTKAFLEVIKPCLGIEKPMKALFRKCITQS